MNIPRVSFGAKFAWLQVFCLFLQISQTSSSFSLYFSLGSISLKTSQKTHLLVPFIIIGSGAHLRTPLLFGLYLIDPKNPLLNFKQNQSMFSKNSFIPILALRKSSFHFQSLTNFKILCPWLIDFPIKTSNY